MSGPALAQVHQLGRVVGRAVEHCRLRLLVAERELEPVADRKARRALDRLLLVRDVAALAGLAHAEALDRLGKDHRRPALAA